jgi:uncharacterized protein with GYD domain
MLTMVASIFLSSNNDEVAEKLLSGMKRQKVEHLTVNSLGGKVTSSLASLQS